MASRNVYQVINDVAFFSFSAMILYNMIKLQENKIIMSEDQYRNLFLSNPTPMWIFNKDTLQFVEVNDAAIEKYGYSRDEFLKLTIKDIRPESDHTRLEQLTNESKDGINTAGRWEHLKKSGEKINVSIVSHPVVFNRQRCKMVIATDITDIVLKEQQVDDAYRKEKKLNTALEKKIKAIKKAQEQSRLQEKVIDRIQNLVLITNKNAAITWVNKAFTEFTGYTLKESLGKQPGELLFGQNTNMETVKQLVAQLEKGEFCSAELINYKKTGEEYWTQISISPIFNNAGEFQFNLAVENIITERKEKEKALAEQHNVLTEVAWSNSHELRRPLCSIISMVELLKNSTDEEEKQQLILLLNQCSVELDEIVRNNNDKLTALTQTKTTNN